MTWIDDSAVTVSGVIKIAANDMLPGVEQCGMSNIVMKAFSLTDLNFQNPVATSSPTDGSGRWALALPVHQLVVLRPYYHGEQEAVTHDFSPSWMNVSVGASHINHLESVDTTLNTFTVNVVGGMCNYPIVTVTPVFELPSCNNRRWIVSSRRFHAVESTFKLPATNITFVAYSGRPDEPSLTGLSNLSPSELSAVKSYLLNNGELDLDLSNHNVTHVLRYYSPPSIEVVGPYWAETPQCVDDAGYGFSIVQEGMVADYNFK